MDVNIKIAVLCGGRFAFPAIQALGIEKYLAGVAIGTSEKSIVSLVRSEMDKNAIPFLCISDKNEIYQLKDWLTDIKANAVFSICFPFLIPTGVLSILPDRFINFHTGSLPEYRGPSPIFEVLRSMEKETALTIHVMNESFDKGPVILREQVAIGDGETFGALATKLSALAAMSSVNIAQMLTYGSSLPSTLQNVEGAAYYPSIEPIDTLIRWEHMHAKEIESLINACNPWNTGADTSLKGQAVKIVAVKVIDKMHGKTPGIVFDSEDSNHVLIACVEEQCLILEIISTDLGIMSGINFKLRFQAIGMRFGS